MPLTRKLGLPYWDLGGGMVKPVRIEHAFILRDGVMIRLLSGVIKVHQNRAAVELKVSSTQAKSKKRKKEKN